MEAQGKLTSLVFPTYNPGSLIDSTWEALRQFLAERPEAWEVVFVSDGCTDRSDQRLADLIAVGPSCVRLLRLPYNRGKGHAVRRGLEACQGHWRLFADVDLAYSFDDILRLARVLWEGAPVAVASRGHPASRLIVPPRLHGYAYRRHLQSGLFSLLARTLLPLRQTDPQAGLKGFTAGVAELLLPLSRCDGFALDCELLTACARLGIPVAEVPVAFRCEGTQSTTGLRSTLTTLWELGQIRRRWPRSTMLAPTLRTAAVDVSPLVRLPERNAA